jgi:hypothetical protein
MPPGWVFEVITQAGEPDVYAATCPYRAAGPHLRFESTSAMDLLDQVHEALDAWQTELELAQAIARHPHARERIA